MSGVRHGIVQTTRDDLKMLACMSYDAKSLLQFSIVIFVIYVMGVAKTLVHKAYIIFSCFFM